MEVAGIVTEYNPFHRGHAYQIEETRRRLGSEARIVCVMSGNWVQRADCAVTDKWSRAAMALAGGADLVLELPTPWAISSAEGFARGAVEILSATGVVKTLSFGSESGRLEDLRAAAACLESEDYRSALKAALSDGIPFASARQKAAEACIGPAAECLRRPNDNLAVEYLRTLPDGLGAIAIPRAGVGHDQPPAGGYASASWIRARLRAGEPAEEFLAGPWRGEIADFAYVERAAIAQLRRMPLHELEAVPDSGEGLAARVLAAAKAGRTLEEIFTLAKTKRYAHARIRRMALWAFLGLTAADRPEHVPYLRVLGFRPQGRVLLKRMYQSASRPILVKTAHVRGLSSEAQALFGLEARCTDLFALCFPEVKPGGMEWTTGPVVLN